MLNVEKIKLMTKLAIYEKNEGKEDIPISKYYKSDYIRYNLLKSIVSVTIGYGLILVLIGIYNLEYIIGEAINLDYKVLGSQVLRVYLILMGIYLSISIILSTINYEKSRKGLKSYYNNLKKLRKIYSEKQISEEERGETYQDDGFTGF